MRLDGVLLVLFATFWFSLATVLVKAVGPDVPVVLVAFMRNIVALPLLAAAMRRRGEAFGSAEWPRLILRGVFGALAMSLFFYVLPRMPIASSTLLRSSSPLFAALWGVLFMRERLDRWAVVCIVVAFAGVYTTLRSSLEFDAFPCLLALASAVFSSLAFATVKSLSRSEPALRIVFYMGVVGTCLFLPGAVTSGASPTPAQWLMMAGVGLSATVGQLFLTAGIGRAPVSRATLGTLFLLVLNILAGLLLWGEVPDFWTWAGCLMITGGILGLAARSQGRLVTLGH